jgi:heme a synthase
MVFNMNSTADGTAATAAASHSRAAVRVWLYSIAVLIVAMVMVGGATRLTGSGLSITEWKPIMGAVPPLNDADWQDAFHKYHDIPQFKLINRGMNLDEFKGIYWWEWSHRFLGRLIGVVFLVPLLIFWARGAISRPLLPKLVGIFVLGGLQGALGWFMVMSGLAERTSVSHYRLAAHLGLAVITLAAVLWVAFGLAQNEESARPRTQSRGIATTLLALIYVQILAGALVAGMRAGMGYNTWPLMDGAFVPIGLGAMQPWWLNAFENALTVQFDHRILAYAIVALALVNTLIAAREVRGIAATLLLAVLGQATLGIFTLLAQVPVGLALTHQVAAIAVFALALYQVHHTSRVTPANSAQFRHSP